MKYYTGPKPCAGCRKPGSESKRAYVDSLCYDCQDLLKMGLKKVEILDKFKDYVNLRICSFNTGDTFESSNIFEKLRALIKTFENPTQFTKETKYIGSFHSGDNNVIVTANQYEAIKDLYDQLKLSCENIFVKGKKEDNNLLMRLHNGSISLNDFTIEKESY